MRNIITRKSAVSLAATAVLAVSLAACSQDTGTEAQAGNQQQSSQQEQTAPKAVAPIPALTGEDTAVALDKGFTNALNQLKLTPGVVGSAKLTDGSLVFPITGGNVTVFEPGDVDPYVIGQVQHEGSASR